MWYCSVLRCVMWNLVCVVLCALFGAQELRCMSCRGGVVRQFIGQSIRYGLFRLSSRAVGSEDVTEWVTLRSLQLLNHLPNFCQWSLASQLRDKVSERSPLVFTEDPPTLRSSSLIEGEIRRSREFHRSPVCFSFSPAAQLDIPPRTKGCVS